MRARERSEDARAHPRLRSTQTSSPLFSASYAKNNKTTQNTRCLETIARVWLVGQLAKPGCRGLELCPRAVAEAVAKSLAHRMLYTHKTTQSTRCLETIARVWLESAGKAGLLWPGAVSTSCGRSRGQELWPGALAQSWTCGKELWPRTVARSCGQELWPEAMAKSGGQKMWRGAVARNCGQSSGHELQPKIMARSCGQELWP